MNEEKPPQKRIEISRQPQKTIISLWLDDYNDFFSDFDPRPYSHRALSDDFISESKKVTYAVKPGEFNVTFLIPHNKRNKTEEEVIKNRLHSHFKKYFTHLESEHGKYIRKGMLTTCIGVVLMLGAMTALYFSQFNFAWNYARILLEPSGWFTAWFGLDQIFYVSREDLREMEFNHKMMHADFRFDAY